MNRADGTSALAAASGPGGGNPGRSGRHADALIFVGEMYGVQLDQLATILGVTQRRASAIVATWSTDGLADAARLGPGQRWVWLTRPGLVSCGLPYVAGAPGLSRLAHLRAVTAIRLALAATPLYAEGSGYWRSERRLRARIGGRIGLREHVPDGEVHWPDSAPVPWAGECWAIEAELTPKTLPRTAAIMTELLTRTGDYGCSAADARVPGQPSRHSRAIYLCSPAARPVVIRARDKIGPLAARVEIRLLPPGAELPATPSRAPAPAPRRTRPKSAATGRPAMDDA